MPTASRIRLLSRMEDALYAFLQPIRTYAALGGRGCRSGGQARATVINPRMRRTVARALAASPELERAYWRAASRWTRISSIAALGSMKQPHQNEGDFGARRQPGDAV